MFNNIGKKIQIAAIVFMIFGCISSVVGAIACWVSLETFWAGFAVLFAGVLLSWVASILLYGFGELIIQTTKTANRMKNLQMLVCKDEKSPENPTKESIDDAQKDIINDFADKDGKSDDIPDTNAPNNDECPACFGKISPDDEECPRCGHKLK